MGGDVAAATHLGMKEYLRRSDRFLFCTVSIRVSSESRPETAESSSSDDVCADGPVSASVSTAHLGPYLVHVPLSNERREDGMAKRPTPTRWCGALWDMRGVSMDAGQTGAERSSKRRKATVLTASPRAADNALAQRWPFHKAEMTGQLARLSAVFCSLVFSGFLWFSLYFPNSLLHSAVATPKTALRLKEAASTGEGDGKGVCMSSCMRRTYTTILNLTRGRNTSDRAEIGSQPAPPSAWRPSDRAPCPSTPPAVPPRRTRTCMGAWQDAGGEKGLHADVRPVSALSGRRGLESVLWQP